MIMFTWPGDKMRTRADHPVPLKLLFRSLFFPWCGLESSSAVGDREITDLGEDSGQDPGPHVSFGFLVAPYTRSLPVAP